MNKYLLLTLVASLFCLSSYPSSLNLRNINSDAGLSQNNIKAIYQDSYGFLWFGSKNKLNRYNGNAIKVFDCYDMETKMGNNNIGAILEDSNKKLWLGTDKGIYIFDSVDESFSFFHIETEEGITINNWISTIQKDNKNNIWIVAPNQGVFKYNEKSKKLSLYSVVDQLLPSVSNPQCMVITKEGDIWIGTNGSGIFKYDSIQENFTQYTKNKDSSISIEGKNIYTMASYDKDLFIGIHEEKVLKFNIQNSIFEEVINTSPSPNYKIIRDLAIINEKELWIGTQSGIYIIDLENKAKNKHLQEDLVDPTSLSDNLIETIFQDREGNIWIGTRSGGVDNLPKSGINFNIFSPNENKQSLRSKKVRRIIEDEEQRIWICTEDAGVFILTPQTELFSKVERLHSNHVLSLMKNEEKVFIGYFKNGLDIITNKKNAQTIEHYTPKQMGLNEESVYTMCKDKLGNIWLGNAWGVYLAKAGSMSFERQTQFGLCYTHDIVEDSEGEIWVATMGSGVFRYTPSNKIITHYVVGEKENTLSSNSVSSITEDHEGKIWFSTDRGGICVYNKTTGDFKRYSISEGLPDDVAYKIIEDRQNTLWFGTNKGLVKFDPSSESVTVFTKENGLQSNQFNYNAGLMTQDGNILFGTANGMISFNPHNIKTNYYIPPVYINSLSILNDEVNDYTPSGILQKAMIHTQEVILPYNKTNISLGFVSLSYTSPMNNQFLYMMEGVDETWVTSNKSQSASYSNLAPGKYRFKVKGSNNDGIWNPEEASIDIIVTPPWWKSNMAYVLYTVFLILIIYITLRKSANRYAKRLKQKQHLDKIQHEKELYEDKVFFFTNIAHEIRTPLSLISAPLESLLESDIKDQAADEYLNIIEKNTKNLLLLVDQLLDFKNVNKHSIKLHYQKVDILKLIDDISFLFKAQLSKSNKTLTIENKTNSKKLEAIVDRDGLFKILNNLISNAVKYSHSNISISIKNIADNFEIHIINDGLLIPEEYRDKIFEPFFRVKEFSDISGSGIGLSLAYSLVMMHNGSLIYNAENNFNNFILTIPLFHEYRSSEATTERKPINNQGKTPDFINTVQKEVSQTRILLVEDNNEILHFLKLRLSEQYNIHITSNGAEAVEVLKKEKIDIVISDVMMPEMNGFQLCEYIKKEEQLSHIIVILLTAKGDLDSKIKGLELGADAYIEKPFSMKYLNTLIKTLLANKIRDTNIFRKRPIAFSKQIKMRKADDDFISKLNEIIQKNIANPDFNVIALAENLNISRSGLHRKVTEILEISPVEHIRLCRLQKAAELISEGTYRINEISYMIGINTPSYFIKIFQAHYGMTPKEYEEHIKDNIR